MTADQARLHDQRIKPGPLPHTMAQGAWCFRDSRALVEIARVDGTADAFDQPMPSTRGPAAQPEPIKPARPPHAAQNRPDPAGQSPDAPIEFTSDDDVARGNAERANAEPEPAALHHAEVPGTPDRADERRHEAAKRLDS